MMKRILHSAKVHAYSLAWMYLLLIGVFSSIIQRNIVFIVCVLGFLILDTLAEWVRYLIYRKIPLSIETPDGSNEPYHPSVVYFENGWNGYKYWMAFTPMPVGSNKLPYPDRWECPCVYVSNDGKSFFDSYNNGFIDDLTEFETSCKDYFSDCHLLFNDESNELELYYRLNNHTDNQERIRLIKRVSKDGRTWSNRIIVEDTKNDGTMFGSETLISPAIIKTQDQYEMWYVSSYSIPHTVSYTISDDAVDWQLPQHCQFMGHEVDPWHIDCKYISGAYIMLVFEHCHRLTLWESLDGIHFTYKKRLLKKSPILGQFYHNGLYRACLLPVNERLMMYFSARHQAFCCLGLAEIQQDYCVRIINGAANHLQYSFWKDFELKYLSVFIKLLERIRR